MKRDIAILLLILGAVACLYGYGSKPAETAIATPTPTPARPALDLTDCDVGGIRLGMTGREVEAVLGPPQEKTKRWEYGDDDTSRVQSVSFDQVSHHVRVVTGAALFRKGQELARTGMSGEKVEKLLGKPRYVRTWHNDSERIWAYPRPWGRLELHMARDGSGLLHVRLCTQ